MLCRLVNLLTGQSIMSGRSASTSTPSLGLSELREWLETLGLSLVPEEDTPVKEQLRDGVLLCQLVNKLRPGSVETVSNCLFSHHAIKKSIGMEHMLVYTEVDLVGWQSTNIASDVLS